jgi:hypothetical protein
MSQRVTSPNALNAEIGLDRDTRATMTEPPLRPRGDFSPPRHEGAS